MEDRTHRPLAVGEVQGTCDPLVFGVACRPGQRRIALARHRRNLMRPFLHALVHLEQFLLVCPQIHALPVDEQALGAGLLALGLRFLQYKHLELGLLIQDAVVAERLLLDMPVEGTLRVSL